MSFEEKDLTGDTSGLGPFELEALQDWEYKFMSKYVKVGTVKKPGEPAESTDHDVAKPAEDGPAESTDHDVAKPAEDGPSESTDHDVAKPAEDGPSESAAIITEETPGADAAKE
jgi:membrane-associated progesterone receptor component